MSKYAKLTTDEFQKLTQQFHDIFTTVSRDIAKLDMEFHPFVTNTGDDVFIKWRNDFKDLTVMTALSKNKPYCIVISSTHRAFNVFQKAFMETLFPNIDIHRNLHIIEDTISLIEEYSKYSVEELALLLKMRGFRNDWDHIEYDETY